MSALEEVVAGIDHCLGKITDACAALAQALSKLEEAGQPDGLGALLGSQDPEAHQALALATQAAEQIVLLHRTLTRAQERIRSGRAMLMGDASGEGARTDRAPHLRAVADSLPASPRGARMHGRYLSGNGPGDPLLSGPTRADGTPDKDWRMACSYLADAAPDQFKAERPPMFAQHVEAKFAMRMWRERIIDADIVLEARPCGSDSSPDDVAARLTCARWLPRMLPPGATLRVTARSGETYTYHRPRRSE